MSIPQRLWIPLTVSFLLVAFFGFWARAALTDGPLQSFDNEVALGWRDVAANQPWYRQIVIAFTHIGGVRAMIGLALVGVFWQLQRGNRKVALAWALIVASGGLLNYTLKKTFDRPRPPAEWRDPVIHENNESFPSGHSMGGLIGYGMAAFVLTRTVRQRGFRLLILLAAALVIGMIGFSRIDLRAHWFSDVIGGFAIGAAWLTLGLACLQSRLDNAPKDQAGAT